MTPRRPLALLFDLDDTLWPIGPVIAAAETSWHDWLARHVPAVSERYTVAALRAQRLALLAERPELALDLYQLRHTALAQVFAEVGADPTHLDGAMQHFRARRNAVTPYAEVLPALTALGQLLPLGVITNGNADLDVIGLQHHFKVTLAASRFGRAKPDPAIFLAACAALKVAPADAVYVGDDLRLDVQGAQAAGLRAVWLDRHGSGAEREAGIVPDAVCASLDSLLAWVHTQIHP